MTRNKQTMSLGLGSNYLTLEKPGPRTKNKVLVSRPGQESKSNEILEKLLELDEKKHEASPIMPEDPPDVFEDVFQGLTADSEMDWEDEPTSHHHQVPEKTPKRHKTRDLKVDTKVQYDAWKALIPSLVEPLLSYVGRSSGNATPHKVDIAPCSLCVGTKTCHVMCLFWDRNKREPLGEAETLGGGWGVGGGPRSLNKFFGSEDFKEFDASRRLIYIL
jgi:hypothetical protein